MMYQELCQNCVWETHPTMLTCYCLIGGCDRCGRHADLAVVKHVQPGQPRLPLEGE